MWLNYIHLHGGEKKMRPQRQYYRNGQYQSYFGHLYLWYEITGLESLRIICQLNPQEYIWTGEREWMGYMSP